MSCGVEGWPYTRAVAGSIPAAPTSLSSGNELGLSVDRHSGRRGGTSAELGRWSVLAQVLVEWKATAAVYAGPALVEELTRPLEADLGPVPAPDGA